MRRVTLALGPRLFNMDANQLQAASDRLAEKIGGLDLDPDERMVLNMLYQAASRTGVESDVQGFATGGFSPMVSISFTYDEIKFDYQPQRDD
jgi:hypothetical protein